MSFSYIRNIVICCNNNNNNNTLYMWKEQIKSDLNYIDDENIDCKKKEYLSFSLATTTTTTTTKTRMTVTTMSVYNFYCHTQPSGIRSNRLFSTQLWSVYVVHIPHQLLYSNPLHSNSILFYTFRWDDCLGWSLMVEDAV